jgi:CubicO group peptidase (beta-lactamase class C family)
MFSAPQHGVGQTGQNSAPRLEEVRANLLAAVASGEVGSAVGLVARGDQILLLDAAGTIGGGDPMPVNAIARIASIQKPITAAAVLLLVERGLLQLGDTVSRWFPGFGAQVLTADGDTVAAERRVTLRDLLTHEAGLVPQGPELDALWDVSSTQQFARRMGAIPLRFEPGTRFEYGCCGSAYEVLAAIVERVSGRSFRDFLYAEVLDPLGMKDTYFFVPEPKRHRLAAIHARDAEGRVTTRIERGDEATENAFYSGGGGLRSTVQDYYRFVLMLLNGGELDGVRLLQSRTVHMMTTNQAQSLADQESGWGFGMRVRNDSTGVFGWNGGTGTRFEVDPASGGIAIIFVPSWPGTQGVSEVRNGFIGEALAAVRR